jgi:Leo1-like protein
VRNCPIDNIIRYRYLKETTEEDCAQQNDLALGIGLGEGAKTLKVKYCLNHGFQVESNAKIVKWSDGTYSLAIGEEFFDMNIESLSKRQCFAKHDNISLYKGTVERRIIVKPPQTQRYFSTSLD